MHSQGSRYRRQAERALGILVVAACGCSPAAESIQTQTTSFDDGSELLAVLPRCEQTAAQRIDRLLTESPGAGSEAYELPSLTAESSLADTISDLVRGEVSEFSGLADATGLETCALEDVVLIAAPQVDGRSPIILLRLGEASEWALSVPHPFYERESAQQALLTFEYSQARALLISGSHRCSNSTPAGCSGASNLCGGEDQPYPESDMAHVVEGYFHRAHEQLAYEFPGLHFASLHGMQAPGVSISNGTLYPADTDSVVAHLVTALSNAAPNDRVSSCNDFEGAALRQHLCGTKNAQGRMLNGVPDACLESAERASGRFVHVEQSMSWRSNPDRARVLARALVDAQV